MQNDQEIDFKFLIKFKRCAIFGTHALNLRGRNQIQGLQKNIPAFSRIHPEPIDSEAPKETSPIDGLLFPVGHQGRLASVRLEVGL